jgi:hypothetical protein
MRNMHLFWGLVTIAIGAFMSFSGILRSDFIIYRLLVARSKMLWGDRVHLFYVIVGAIVVIVGILIAVGVFRRVG